MAVRVSSTDILTTTVSSTAGIVDPVASGITGWSPGDSDTSGTILDVLSDVIITASSAITGGGTVD